MSDKVAADVCAAEFKKLCELRRIDTDPANMSELEAAQFEGRKKAILRAMARKEVVVNPDGLVVFTPQGGKAITFYKATGATLMAQDGHGPYHNIARVVAIATELTKSPPGNLSELPIEDFELVCEITNFLLVR